jgi:hypothetical protein
MILTVAELRQYITTDEEDQVLEAKLQALELLIRAYTNNNFQARAFRAVAVASSDGNKLLFNSPIPFKVGDTLQITESDFMQDELVTVLSVDGSSITVSGDLSDESGVVVTKVKYPMDVKMGIVNLMKWELDNREKVGVASESISRHSVTYVDQTGDNTIMGYPVALMGFLKPYRRARFGRGIRV